MHPRLLMLSHLVPLILTFSQVRGTDQEPSSAAIKFCHEGRIYMARLDQCPGGLLLKPKFRHLPDCICSNGIFLHKGSSSKQPYGGIVANSGLRCSSYKFQRDDHWNLLLPLTPPASPFVETVTVIPYENGTDRLDYFRMRRYSLNAVQLEDAPPAQEIVTREKVFLVGNRRDLLAPEQIQIGNLCVKRIIGFNDGVYIQDLDSPSVPLNVTYRVGINCNDDALKLTVSEPENIYRYETYAKGHCVLPSNCIQLADNIFEVPDLMVSQFDQDEAEETLQRFLSRGTKCETIIEENVQLAEYFTRLLHKQVIPYPVSSMTMQILQSSFEVFKAAIGNAVVPHVFLDQIFRYFHYLYYDRDGTRVDKRFATKLLYYMESCRQNALELQFTMGGCPVTVDFYNEPTSLFGHELVNIEVGQELKYDETKFDIIAEVAYKVVNFVYNYCSEPLDPLHYLNEYYRKIMVKLLLTPEIQKRWKESCVDVTSSKQYRSILPYGDLSAIMFNVDAVVATVMRNSSGFIPRPELKAHRKRRSILDYYNYEIWGGGAYCLQLSEYPESRGPATWGILPDITRLITP